MAQKLLQSMSGRVVSAVVLRSGWSVPGLTNQSWWWCGGVMQCDICQKGLVGGSYVDHQGKPHCQSCYNKHHRPKGFGHGATTVDSHQYSKTSDAGSAAAAAPAPAAGKFCTGCGAERGTGKFCGGCVCHTRTPALRRRARDRLICTDIQSICVLVCI